MAKEKRKALAVKNRPRTLGLQFYAIVWLLMDRWRPDGWVWGVVGAFCAFVFIATVMDVFSAEDVSLDGPYK